jgi:hypothetical protein
MRRRRRPPALRSSGTVDQVAPDSVLKSTGMRTLTPEEASELAERLAQPLGATFSTAEILAQIAERARREG